MPDLPLRCTCGSLRGVARDMSPRANNRVVCYCDDCQSFAHAVERADDVLDAHGGTDITQMSPARIEFTAGLENLACLRLTSKGMLRWYASCCGTPIGNTSPNPNLPFVGMIHSIFDHAGDGRPRDEVFGPVRGAVQGKFAKHVAPGETIPDRPPLSMITTFLRLILGARFRGDGKRSGFLDPQTGQLRTEPRVLSSGELAEVERRRDAA